MPGCRSSSDRFPDFRRIIHIDGRLEEREDYFAHKVANLLRLTHKQLIDAKLSARQQLAATGE
jgi:hypothetical protein